MTTELLALPPPDFHPPTTYHPPDLVTLWLSGRSPNTVAAYAKDVAHFARWYCAATPAAAVESLLNLSAGEANAVVIGYRADQLAAGLAGATIGRRLAALRSVVTLARATGRVAWTLEVPSPKPEPRRDVRGPDKAERRRLWKAAAGLGDDRRARRDRAALALLFDLGLRRAEVVALDVEHVEHPEGAELPTALRIRGKGRRELARVTLPRETGRTLLDWLDARGNEPGALFVRTDRPCFDRLSGEGLARAVGRAGTAAGLPRKLRPHGLRHAAITAALDNGHDIRKVRIFSRHAKLETVIRYDDARDDSAGSIAGDVARERRSTRR